ncbi:MAG: biotin attachment protein [Planctomycetes bacterium]|nr:biotin attachment protein [Planctomycetota bacterium]
MTLNTTGWQPITLPELGAEGQQVRVSTWLTQIGEEVVASDPVVEVLLRGMTFDVEAPSSGRLRRIGCFENDVIATGDTLGWIELDDVVSKS